MVKIPFVSPFFLSPSREGETGEGVVRKTYLVLLSLTSGSSAISPSRVIVFPTEDSNPVFAPLISAKSYRNIPSPAANRKTAMNIPPFLNPAPAPPRAHGRGGGGAWGRGGGG